VRPLRFTWPVYRGARVPRWKLTAGLALYDALALFRNVGTHRALGAGGVRAIEPAVRADGLTGGATYWDAATDDARLTLATARAAADAGAVVVTHAEARALAFTAPDGPRGARARVAVHDRLGGETVEVRARVVVSAAGPWTDAVRRLAEPGAPSAVLGAKGVHLAVPAARVGNRGALTLLHPRDGRVLFILPADGFTDRRHDGDAGDRRARGRPRRRARRGLPARRGERLLPRGAPRARRRGERVGGDPPARRRGRGARRVGNGGGVARARHRARRARAGDGERWQAHHVPRDGERDRGRVRGAARRAPAAVAHRGGAAPGAGLADAARPDALTADAARARRATRRWARGSCARTAPHGATCWRSPIPPRAATRRSGARLVPALPYVRAEVVHAVRHEWAATLADVLVRRLPIAYETRDAGRAAARVAAPLVARELGWDDAAVRRALADYDAEAARLFGIDA
jgi:glycerol-3-phosphate dehydrogenase